MTQQKQFVQRPNTGSLFKNTRRTKDTQPEYTGSGNLKGDEFWISGWVKVRNNGEKYFSFSFTPKKPVYNESQKLPEKKEVREEPFDENFTDEIPF